MKLNIWIVKEWLTEYNPTLMIADGKKAIEGVRFLSNYIHNDNRYIYICQSTDLFSGTRSEEVLLVHCNDVISLRVIDMEDIFNKVMECFEFYNNWERTLLESAQIEQAEQHIIDACNNMFGPIFIMDLKLNLIAYSQNYKPGEVNSIWDEFIRFSKPSLKTIYLMRSSNFIRLLPFRHNCLVFEEPNASPYSYGIIISHCDADSKLIGQWVICINHPITERDLWLAKTVEKAISSIQNRTIALSCNSLAQSIMSEAITTGTLSDHDRRKLMVMQDWSEDGLFHIIQISIADTSENDFLVPYSNQISMYFPNSVTLINKERIMLCVQTNDPTTKLSSILEFQEEQIPAFFGVSYSFSDLSELQAFYRQASFSLEHSIANKKRITHFKECGIYVLTHETDKNYCRHCLHPVVTLLKEYDLANNTEYGLTLRTYLQLERSYLLTAKHLFLHRNTILYRIEKIQELYPLNLENTEEREYILFSFRYLD